MGYQSSWVQVRPTRERFAVDVDVVEVAFRLERLEGELTGPLSHRTFQLQSAESSYPWLKSIALPPSSSCACARVRRGGHEPRR